MDWRAINTTEHECVVRFNTITLGAALHTSIKAGLIVWVTLGNETCSLAYDFAFKQAHYELL